MMPKGKMLILPGNHGHYLDENNKTHNYADGALHEKAAIDYAACKDYVGEVLHLAGDSDEQITKAVNLLKVKASPYTATYGFSGGGYHLLRILKKLPAEALQRITLVVVLGAPPTYPVKDPDSGKTHYPNCDTDLKGNLSQSEKHSCSPLPSDYESAAFAANYPAANIKWELVYWTNPAEKGNHMFGPDWLLAQELKNGCSLKK